MSGIQMALLGAGVAALDIQTVTTGASGTIPNRLRGFTSSPAVGSIVDGTSNIYAGAAVNSLLWNENGGGGAQEYELSIAGATNTGWTTLTIQSTAGTVTLLRASATSFFLSRWAWTTTDLLGAQVFGTASTVVTCTFT